MNFWLIIFIFIVLVYLYDFFTRPYIQRYKTRMLFGKKGVGKTLFIVAESLKALIRGYSVYCNVKIPGTIYFNPKTIVGNYSFIPGSKIFIDEVGLIWDKRDFANFDKNVGRFFRLARHYKCEVWLFSQTYDDVDKVIRGLTDELYIIKRFARVFSVAVRIEKVQDISHNQEGNGTIIDDYRYCSLIDRLFFKGQIVHFIPRWVGFYDSFDTDNIPVFSADPVPFTDLQQRHLSTKTWLLDNLSVFCCTVKGRAGAFCKKRLPNLYSAVKNDKLLQKVKGELFNFYHLISSFSKRHKK